MGLIAFSSEVASGSREKTRLDKNPKPGSDSITGALRRKRAVVRRIVLAKD
jgi:hypothetical protein